MYGNNAKCALTRSRIFPLTSCDLIFVSSVSFQQLVLLHCCLLPSCFPGFELFVRKQACEHVFWSHLKASPAGRSWIERSPYSLQMVKCSPPLHFQHNTFLISLHLSLFCLSYSPPFILSAFLPRSLLHVLCFFSSPLLCHPSPSFPSFSLSSLFPTTGYSFHRALLKPLTPDLPLPPTSSILSSSPNYLSTFILL